MDDLELLRTEEGMKAWTERIKDKSVIPSIKTMYRLLNGIELKDDQEITKHTRETNTPYNSSVETYYTVENDGHPGQKYVHDTTSNNAFAISGGRKIGLNSGQNSYTKRVINPRELDA